MRNCDVARGVSLSEQCDRLSGAPPAERDIMQNRPFSEDQLVPPDRVLEVGEAAPRPSGTTARRPCHTGRHAPSAPPKQCQHAPAAPESGHDPTRPPAAAVGRHNVTRRGATSPAPLHGKVGDVLFVCSPRRHRDDGIGQDSSDYQETDGVLMDGTRVRKPAARADSRIQERPAPLRRRPGRRTDTYGHASTSPPGHRRRSSPPWTPPDPPAAR